MLLINVHDNHTQTDRETDRQTDIQTCRQTTCRQTDTHRENGIKLNRNTEKRLVRMSPPGVRQGSTLAQWVTVFLAINVHCNQTQTDKQTDSRTDTHTHTLTHPTHKQTRTGNGIKLNRNTEKRLVRMSPPGDKHGSTLAQCVTVYLA